MVSNRVSKELFYSRVARLVIIATIENCQLFWHSFTTIDSLHRFCSLLFGCLHTCSLRKMIDNSQIFIKTIRKNAFTHNSSSQTISVIEKYTQLLLEFINDNADAEVCTKIRCVKTVITLFFRNCTHL